MDRILSRPAGLAALALIASALLLGPLLLPALAVGGLAFAVVVPGKRPAGATAIIAAGLGLLAGAVSLDLPAEVAASFAGLAILAVSWFAPRWAESRGLLAERPVGASALVTTVLVWFAPLAGVDLDPQEATTFVGVVAFAVSLFTPRQTV